MGINMYLYGDSFGKKVGGRRLGATIPVLSVLTCFQPEEMVTQLSVANYAFFVMQAGKTAMPSAPRMLTNHTAAETDTKLSGKTNGFCQEASVAVSHIPR